MTPEQRRATMWPMTCAATAAKARRRAEKQAAAKEAAARKAGAE